MPEAIKKDIGKLFNDREGMDRALARAVRQALLQHKRAGNPVATWRDGKVVWIAPEEIEVSEESEKRNPSE
jgi:hypothetical protein